MRIIVCLIVASVVATASAAAPIELELATERGVQITAPHEWLQLLTTIGIHNVRIRGEQPGDVPAATNRGTDERPRYHVLGLLSARDQLRLPGGTFGRGDRARLKDYFDGLAADGIDSQTSPRGPFGLTEKELEAVFAELAQPIEFETKGLPPMQVIERLQARLASPITADADTDRTLRAASPVADELQGIAVGTGLAILLRSSGLALRPEKPRGEPVTLRIVTLDAAALAQKSVGRPENPELKHWPIGWEPDQLPRQLAPALFEFLNAEIDGYTLEETLAAIGPRVKVPIYLDHAALAAHQIDPAAIQVSLPRTRTFHKRLLDRVLSQARLGGELRIDEVGTAFFWITR